MHLSICILREIKCALINMHMLLRMCTYMHLSLCICFWEYAYALCEYAYAFWDNSYAFWKNTYAYWQYAYAFREYAYAFCEYAFAVL